jgi:alpha-L-arabinofuranosidase
MRQGDVVELATQSMLIGDGWKIHAVWCDRNGKMPPFLLPSGQITMLYSRHHGSQRLQLDVSNLPCYEQPYRMAGIGPAHQAAYLDILATRDETRLYLHAINRHFDQTLTLQVDLSALGRSAGVEGMLHILEGRLNNAPTGSEPLAPAEIREEEIAVASQAVTVRLPRRSVGIVEIPIQPAAPAR